MIRYSKELSYSTERLSQPQYLDLKPYIPGKPPEYTQRELGLARVVKLASNENPLGPSPKVIEAIHAHVKGLGRYPDSGGYAITQALSNFHQVPPESISIGNGSEDLINCLARAFLGQGSSAICSEYGFVTYKIACQATHCEIITVTEKNYQIDIEAILAAIKSNTKLIFIANPNNPTGTWVSGKAIQKLIDGLPNHVLLVLDEAYSEYMINQNDYYSHVRLKLRDNVIILKTFSKAYGLAGIRFGYAISHPEIAALLSKVRMPFNTNSLGQIAANAALSDQDWLAKAVAHNQQWILPLSNYLLKNNIYPINQDCNFICFKFGGRSGELFASLERRGIIVRHLVGFGMPDYIRISVGTAEEMTFLFDQFTSAVEEVIK